MDGIRKLMRPEAKKKNVTFLVTRHLTTSNKKLLVAPGITTSSKKLLISSCYIQVYLVTRVRGVAMD